MRDDRIPDWLLERLLLDELPPDEARALTARIAADPATAARLDALRESNRAILAAYPVDRVVREIERRARAGDAREAASPPRRRRWMAGAGVAAAAAAALVVIALGERAPVSSDREPVTEHSTRPKGEPHLVIHRKLGDGAEALTRRAPVRAGERLQVSYIAAGKRYGVVLSIDGRGLVTRHFPDPAGGDQTLGQDGRVPLSYSYELDDAPAFERFVLITADHPIDVDEVMRRARRLAADPARARSADLQLPS